MPAKFGIHWFNGSYRGILKIEENIRASKVVILWFNGSYRGILRTEENIRASKVVNLYSSKR
jgi:hypothetical protein